MTVTLGGKIMDIKTETIKDLEYVEGMQNDLKNQYDKCFDYHKENCGADEDEFESDLAVAHDLLNMEVLDKNLPSAIYIKDLETRLKMIENALNTLNSDKNSSSHNAHKAFEVATSYIRQMKSRVNEQINEANKTIALLDEWLDLCDKYRK